MTHWGHSLHLLRALYALFEGVAVHWHESGGLYKKQLHVHICTSAFESTNRDEPFTVAVCTFSSKLFDWLINDIKGSLTVFQQWLLQLSRRPVEHHCCVSIAVLVWLACLFTREEGWVSQTTAACVWDYGMHVTKEQCPHIHSLWQTPMSLHCFVVPNSGVCSVLMSLQRQNY